MSATPGAPRPPRFPVVRSDGGSSPPPPPPLPFNLPDQVDSWITKTLVGEVFNNDLKPLDTAVANAKAHVELLEQWGVVDTDHYLRFLSGMLKWIPSDICDGKLIYFTLCLCYYVLDQDSLQPFSTRIHPESVNKPPKPLSKWTSDFAKRIGKWMSEPASINAHAVQSFMDSPLYNYAEADAPDPNSPTGGYKTFNDLFARKLKKGMRPISAGYPNDPDYNRVVVYPADCTFDGAWPVDQDAVVDIKTLKWQISDLLQGSEYAEKFRGGIWMHAFLNTFDYHRQHAPVGGKVLEAKVIEGLAYLQVIADEETKELIPRRGWVPPTTAAEPQKGKDLYGELDAPDDAGYQFLQARGCVIIHNDLLGHVAVLPIGMAQVSSVVLSVKEGDHVMKGDEISCFQFGGSDIVLVFERDANVHVMGARGVDDEGNQTCKQKYLMGMPLGYSTKMPTVVAAGGVQFF